MSTHDKPAASTPPTGKAPARSGGGAGLISPALCAIGVALGCNLAWVLMAFQSMGLFHGFDHAEAVLDQTYLLSIAATTATLAVLGVFHCRTRALLGTPTARIAVPLGMAASTLLMMGNGAGGAAGAVFIAASGILSGVFTALFLMNFGIALALLDLKRSIVAVALGYVVSTVLFFVFLFFEPLSATLFCASMGPVAGAFLYFGASTLGLSKTPHTNPLPEQAVPTDPAERKELRDLVLAFALCMLVTGLAYELSRTIYVQMGSYASGEVANYAIMQGLASTVTVLGSVGAALALIASKGTRGPQVCYRLTICFLILGVLLLPTSLVFPGVPAFLPLAVNIGSFQCLGMVMWILIAGTCRRYLGTCLRTFAFVRAAWAAGPLAGMLVGRALWRSEGFGLEPVFVATVICVMAVVVVNNFIFTEGVLAKALNIMPLERKQRFQERCRAVIERYGLTEREGEIMIMFAKGRNLPYVQEELCLSKSTVSTHRQHIYQKLGVHSAQEMIDLIQGEA